MNDKPELSDADLRAMLDRRADRARAVGTLSAVRAAAAVTPQRRRIGRLGFGPWRRRVAAGLAGVAALAVVALVVVLATGGRPREVGVVPGSASPGSSSVASGSAEPPATPVSPVAAGPVLPLTVDQLNAIMQADPRLLTGRELVISGTLLANPPERCPLGASCPVTATLLGSSPLLKVTGSDASPLSALSRPPTFAARLVDDQTLEFEGQVTLTADGGAFLPSQLAAAEAANFEAGPWLVEGWITGRVDPLPCPYPGDLVSPEPQYGCGETAILSDTNIQPETSDSFTIPPTSVQVQNGAYQEFAPDPSSGIDPISSPAHLSEPEVATFLVDIGPPVPCPSGTFCALDLPGRHWQIIDRVDPWPDLGTIPTPASTVAPSPGAPVAAVPVLPLTVNQLNLYMRMNSQSPDGRQLVITGTIVQKAPGMACTGSCTDWLLQGSDPTLYVKPVGDIGLGPWDQGGEPLTGTFAATMNEPYLLEYQGAVALDADGGPWLPSQLPSPANGPAQTDYWLVHGWMGGPIVVQACELEPARTPYPGPQYGCGEGIRLSDNPPGQAGGSVRVQNGAYDQFAPSPSRIASGRLPEQATYLLQAISIPPCGPTQSCYVAPQSYVWAIVARVGPWPVAGFP